MALMDLVLLRAGAETVAAFQARAGLPPTGVADGPTWQQALPYLTGYRLHRLAPGDTYTALAQRYGTTVSAIAGANPNQDPRALMVDQYLTVPLGFDVVPEDQPFTWALTRLILEGLRARYPFLLLSELTRTRYGRSLFQITVGNGRQKRLFNAAHHANEWITTGVLLRFLEDYARAVAENGRIFGQSARALYEKTTLTLVPMVNPDGVDLVTGALLPGMHGYAEAEAMAADYPAIPFPSGWKANLEGVDLNLQYPALWERARTIKYAQGYDRPGPRDFVGQAPLTQPESIAMAELTRRILPDLTLSYHSQGEVIYWKFLAREPPGARDLAQAFAAVSGYTVEDVPMASAYAGYKDWFIQTWDKPGYTIEVGRGENPLPISQLPGIYRRNLGILVLALNA